jgi:Ca2+/Na+ antiporter
VLEITHFSYLVLLGIGSVVSATFFILELFKINQHFLNTLYEIFSVISAVAWIKVFSCIIIDFISFLAFYFSINEIVLATILLSAGNSLGDFFGNAALAIQGETIMASLACYSGQIFNNFVGLSISILGTAINGGSEFDIFGQKSKIEDRIFGLMPVSNMYVVFVILFVIFILITKLIYFIGTNFVLKKSFAVSLFIIYAIFFCISILFALFFRDV